MWILNWVILSPTVRITLTLNKTEKCLRHIVVHKINKDVLQIVLSVFKNYNNEIQISVSFPQQILAESVEGFLRQMTKFIHSLMQTRIHCKAGGLKILNLHFPDISH
jgi:adenosine deaminase